MNPQGQPTPLDPRDEESLLLAMRWRLYLSLGIIVFSGWSWVMLGLMVNVPPPRSGNLDGNNHSSVPSGNH